MQDYNLKPCPFCGGNKIELDNMSALFCSWICRCSGCNATITGGGNSTKESTIKAWNRRAPEWFSVDKVRPLGERKCLVATKKASLVKLTVAWYYGYGIWKRDYDGRTIEFKVTHWREMPNDWVDACEKLPPDEDKEAYLVKAGSKVTIAKYYGDGEWMTYSLCNITQLVTHWQKLPKDNPWEGEEEDE
jgi:Lar family restriction alleviation protein